MRPQRGPCRRCCISPPVIDALSVALAATNNDTCSNATLTGNYAFTIVSELLNPNGTTSFTHGIALTNFDGAEQAVRGTDMVVAATNSHVPVCKGAWIERGMHLTGVLPNEFDLDCYKKVDYIVIFNRLHGRDYSLRRGPEEDPLLVAESRKPCHARLAPEPGHLALGIIAMRLLGGLQSLFMRQLSSTQLGGLSVAE